MVHILLIMCVLLTIQVGAGLQSVDQTYISRKSPLVHRGYMFGKINNNPGTYEHVSNGPETYSDSKGFSDDLSTYKYIQPIRISKAVTEPVFLFTDSPISKYSADYERDKAETKYYSKYLPSKITTDAMYERLKSVMHYHQPADSQHMISAYDSNNEYHIDDDDIRTSSRSLYDSWPYYYHSPYEYEHIKIGSEIEKAKDKRYAEDTAKAIIPVHENFEEDNTDSPPFGSMPPLNYNEINTDNPIVGDQPFFSFVLNDYFDQSNEEDALVFKGLDWGKEFDNQQPFIDIDDYAKRKRRLQSSYFTPNNNDGTIDSLVTNGYDYDVTHGETVTEKGHNNNRKIDKYEKGDYLKHNHIKDYERNRNNYKGFKDFVSSFANKFGSEDYKKGAKYNLKRNHHKGGKKKGFRRVYHKNEYQEEDEFYDNNNNHINVEEIGNSSAHIGGLEAYLQSHTAAALDRERFAQENPGNNKNKNFKNNHNAHSENKDLDSALNTYRDIAKETVHSNNVDYTDHYSI